MATIGAAKAIAQTGRIRMSGFIAWLAWLFIHILYLARFENRMLVLFQWTWNYLTRKPHGSPHYWRTGRHDGRL